MPLVDRPGVTMHESVKREPNKVLAPGERKEGASLTGPRGSSTALQKRAISDFSRGNSGSRDVYLFTRVDPESGTS